MRMRMRIRMRMGMRIRVKGERASTQPKHLKEQGLMKDQSELWSLFIY